MKYYYKNSKTMAINVTNRGLIIVLLLGFVLIVVGTVFISAGYTLHNDYLEQKKLVDNIDNFFVNISGSKTGIILHDDGPANMYIGIAIAILGVIMSTFSILEIVEGPFTLYEPDYGSSSGPNNKNNNRYDDVKDNSVNIYTGMN